MAIPDRLPNFGVSNLALILQFVGRDFRDDGDDTAGCLDFEFLPTLEAGPPASGLGNHQGFFIF